MTLKRVTLTYLAAYLVFGGVGLAFAPDLALDLLLATEEYDDTMPRLVGMFMIALGGFIGMMVYRRDYTYYRYSIVARTGIVAFLLGLFADTEDRLFIVFTVIVLIGLAPSYVVILRERRS